MSRKAGRADVAPLVRGAFHRALARLANDAQYESKETVLADKLMEELEEHGILRILDAIAKYCPKELDVEADVKTDIRWPLPKTGLDGLHAEKTVPTIPRKE